LRPENANPAARMGLRIGSAPLSYRPEKPEKMRICHARMLLANAQSRVL
jgi:hypothetical protein